MLPQGQDDAPRLDAPWAALPPLGWAQGLVKTLSSFFFEKNPPNTTPFFHRYYMVRGGKAICTQIVSI